MGRSFLAFVPAAFLAVFTVNAETPDIAAPGAGSVEVRQTAGRIIVASDYWRLEFDVRRGGALDTIVFPHGSGENLITAPLRSYVDQWSDANAETRVAVERKAGFARLAFSGRMTAADGEAGPVSFRSVWTISPFTIRVDRTLAFDSDLRVSHIGIGCGAVSKDLNEFGMRVAPARASDKPKRIAAQYRTLTEGFPVLMREQHTPIYLVFFHRNVEGLDFTMASDLATWESGLAGWPGAGRYEAKAGAGGRSIDLVLEPLSAEIPELVRKGEYTFSYYLGLPRIVERSDRKFRHIAFNNHPWPSDEDIRRWAEHGVNIARLHNDFARDGNFWHDGAWPPYDDKGMQELRHVIATCHRHGIQVVPYFSVHEFHPAAQGYKEYEREWARVVDDAGTIFHNEWLNGEFGAQMCPQSGWLERRKHDVEQAYRELGFDGVYYDWGVSLPCHNKLHNASLHLGTDGIIDLLAWTRRLIGTKGTLIVHCTSLRPSISFENYADLVVNMEVDSDMPEPIRMDRVAVLAIGAESTPRAPCAPANGDEDLDRTRSDIAHWVVLGMFPGAAPSGGFAKEAFQLFDAFRPYRLGDYRFCNALSGAVRTGVPGVYGAVYGSARHAILIVSNTTRQPRKNVNCSVSIGALWGGSESRPSLAVVRDTKTGHELKLPVRKLAEAAITTDLQPFEYKLFEIRPAN